jgi:hypothetical protein
LAAAQSHLGEKEGWPRTTVLPFWDAERRQLWLGDRLIKEFHQAASNQVAVLAEFQRRGWNVRRVANPLAADADETLKARLRHLQDTVKSLNRGLPHGTVHFRVECESLFIQWDFIAGAPETKAC